MSDSFNRFIDSLRQKVLNKNFVEKKISDSEFEFSKGDLSFKILWKNSNVILFSSEKKLCEWYLGNDPTNKDISSISDEFCEFMVGKKENKSKIKNSEVVEDTSNVSFDKMVEKVLQFFPEEREIYQNDNLSSSTIKEKISFLKNNVIIKMNDMIKKTKSDNKTERLIKHLCNSYIFGDENTKCVVSMLFFNGINGENERQKVKKMVPFYLKKTLDASWKIRR